MMRVLHVVPSIGNRSGGLGAIALSLAKHQQAAGTSAAIWCLDMQDQARQIATQQGLAADVVAWPLTGPGYIGYSWALHRTLLDTKGEHFDVVHQHGIWTALSHASIQWRNKFHRPIIIAPHGSLEAWALRKSGWKKRLALAAYEYKYLRTATCLHASAETEVASFRQFGLKNPIALIPNGISDTWIDSVGNGQSFRAMSDIPASTHVMLFLSRITPKKGLPLLMEAMSRLRECLTDWRLVIAGPDEFGHQAELQALIERLKLQPYVQFVGPLFDRVKRDAFAAADIFALPSYSEGAPIAVLEALGAGVPVLATYGSPWRDLVAYQCGWWTPITVEAITDALREVITRPKIELTEMGHRGQTLVRQHYRWSSAAEKSIQLYRWLLGRAERPDFVLIG